MAALITTALPTKTHDAARQRKLVVAISGCALLVVLGMGWSGLGFSLDAFMRSCRAVSAVGYGIVHFKEIAADRFPRTAWPGGPLAVGSLQELLMWAQVDTAFEGHRALHHGALPAHPGDVLDRLAWWPLGPTGEPWTLSAKEQPHRPPTIQLGTPGQEQPFRWESYCAPSDPYGDDDVAFHFAHPSTSYSWSLSWDPQTIDANVLALELAQAVARASWVLGGPPRKPSDTFQICRLGLIRGVSKRLDATFTRLEFRRIVGSSGWLLYAERSLGGRWVWHDASLTTGQVQQLTDMDGDRAQIDQLLRASVLSETFDEMQFQEIDLPPLPPPWDAPR